MKKIAYTLAFLLLVGFITISCDNNEDPSATTDLITIDMEAGADDSSEIWFVVWDDDGTLLDYKKYTQGEKLTLTTTTEITNNKITVAYLSYKEVGAPIGGGENHSTAIYTDLSPGLTITRKKSTRPQATETFKINVLNEPSGSFFNISSKFGVNDKGAATSGSGPYTCSITPGADKYIVFYDGFPSLYAEIENVSANDEVTIDFNDFKSYENEVAINLPSSYEELWITFDGMEANQPLDDLGYRLSANWILVGSEPQFTTGYFSPLSKFATYISVRYDNAYINYSKVGTAPGTIKWPDAGKYSVESSDPNSLSVSVSEQVEYVHGVWSHSGGSNQSTVNLFSPKLAPKIGQVPDEITAAHPLFSIDRKLYDAWSIQFEVKGGLSYNGIVSGLTDYTLGEYEGMTVTFNRP